MAPRSPTQAFDPSPALEHDSDNFSPLNDPFSSSFSNDGLRRPSKGVHFSDSPVLATGARHSIATTTVPLLPPIASASRVPQQSFRMANSAQGVDINAYIENSRKLNEQLRQTHDTERQAWGIERSALQARIVELESKLNKGRDSKRRSSNDSMASSATSFRTDFRNTFNSSLANGSRMNSESALPSGPPVWKGPEFTPPVTRVFSNEDDVNHLPSISEDEAFPSLSKEVSPTSGGPENMENIARAAEQSGENFDGIVLRPSARKSSFVTKITSPQFSPPARSPPPKPKDGSLVVDMNSLLSPTDEKLKRHAGHTPMAFDGNLSASELSTSLPTPKNEVPPPPAPTKRPPIRPSENSDSYFSFTGEPTKEEATKEDAENQNPEEQEHVQHEAEEDPSLKGPLMLDPSARSQAANSFLEKVDAKLMEAASKPRRDSVLSGSSEDTAINGKEEKEDDSAPPSEAPKDDGMPRLKLKQSMNFGSAWGGDMPGRI